MPRRASKSRQRTEAQHYVPQFYLRRFTNADGGLFCYDKAADRPYPTSTKAAAQETNFYEILPTPELRVPVNAVERALGVVEKTWAPMVADLVKSADGGGASARQVEEFAPFLVMQWMRTKTYRDLLHETIRRASQAFIDELVAVNFPGSKVTVRPDEKSMAAIHAHKLFEPGEVERMADELTRHYWVIGLSSTDRPFYTSDHPVVRRANKQADGRPLVGVRDPGVEFAFPLDSTHILLVLERTHFAAWRQHDMRSTPLTAEQVRDYNALQVMRSCQRVYCAKSDFALAREVCAARPEVRDPKRPRVRVETTPIVDLRNQMVVIALE